MYDEKGGNELSTDIPKLHTFLNGIPPKVRQGVAHQNFLF